MVLSKILLVALAVTANLANASLVVGFDPLVKYSNCSNEQQVHIYEAWFDALKLANAGKDGLAGDWKGEAEIDYFGPSALNHPQQRNIQDIFTKTAGLYRPWWFAAADTKIHARCDDWAKTCMDKGPSVYSSSKCQGSNLTCLTFCGKFFNQPSLTDVIERARPLKNDDGVKLHMSTYQSRASALLHQLFHLSEVSYPLGHIHDRFLRYLTQEGKQVITPAIGPYWTKIFARVDLLNRNETLPGFAINADNLAQYAISKYVYKTFGVHAYYPIALSQKLGDDNVTKALGWDIVAGTLRGNGTLINNFLSADDPKPTESMNGTHPLVHDMIDGSMPSNVTILDLDRFITAEHYRQDYFAGKRAEIDPTGPPSLTLKSNYTKGDENLSCAVFSSIDPGTVSVDVAEGHIKDACSKLKGKALSPNNTGSQLSYLIPNNTTSSAVWIGAYWNTADEGCLTERKITEDECKAQLGMCLNGCQIDTTTEKKGGSRVNNCIVYRLGVEKKSTV